MWAGSPTVPQNSRHAINTIPEFIFCLTVCHLCAVLICAMPAWPLSYIPVPFLEGRALEVWDSLFPFSLLPSSAMPQRALMPSGIPTHFHASFKPFQWAPELDQPHLDWSVHPGWRNLARISIYFFSLVRILYTSQFSQSRKDVIVFKLWLEQPVFGSIGRNTPH